MKIDGVFSTTFRVFRVLISAAVDSGSIYGSTLTWNGVTSGTRNTSLLYQSAYFQFEVGGSPAFNSYGHQNGNGADANIARIGLTTNRTLAIVDIGTPAFSSYPTSVVSNSSQLGYSTGRMVGASDFSLFSGQVAFDGIYIYAAHPVLWSGTIQFYGYS